jgi:hypothetical protein
MKQLTRLLLPVAALCAAALLPACTTTAPAGRYTVKAYRPHNPNNVSVKVSTSTQHIYVKEGDRLLMAVQGCVGANGATGSGSYRIMEKIKTKRRVSQPDAGYPMAYWCAWKPAYGFHEGFVWGIPRTHGCIRMHKEAAARFFALVKIGTPVSIARTQPEDAQYGHFVKKLDQSRDPDPPRSLLMSPGWFRDPAGPLLIEG